MASVDGAHPRGVAGGVGLEAVVASAVALQRGGREPLLKLRRRAANPAQQDQAGAPVRARQGAHLLRLNTGLATRRSGLAVLH